MDMNEFDICRCSLVPVRPVDIWDNFFAKKDKLESEEKRSWKCGGPSNAARGLPWARQAENSSRRRVRSWWVRRWSAVARGLWKAAAAGVSIELADLAGVDQLAVLGTADGDLDGDQEPVPVQRHQRPGEGCPPWGGGEGEGTGAGIRGLG